MALGAKHKAAFYGGGPRSFIGPVHRRALSLDGQIDLTAGAFSGDIDGSRLAASAYDIAPGRCYAGHEALLRGECPAPAEAGIDFLAVLTPNHLHADAACAALTRGLPVFCEKPLATNLAEGRRIEAAARTSGKPFGMAYTYLGYPMVREARVRIAGGEIGTVRRIAVSYMQGWLAEPVELGGNAQAAWRVDPRRSGISGCLADIGVHAQSLADYLTGDPIALVSADLRQVMPGRLLDDDAAVMFRTCSDVPGTLIASQVCAGQHNTLEIEIFGSIGSLRWRQSDPATLRITTAHGERRIVADPAMLASEEACRLLRLPAGHPEGLIAALANLYRAFAQRLAPEDDAGEFYLPGIAEGIRSLAFVEAAVASASQDGRWTALDADPISEAA